MITDEQRMFYGLGQRDTLAFILAEHLNKVKLPALAKEYKENFEEHFSHKWHTT